MYYIENVEIEGFKSYKFKTNLSNLDRNFNAITGKNGAGKSNILDAICFVLGLSNLSIVRALVIDDLIFKGKRETANFANVSLFLSCNYLIDSKSSDKMIEKLIISRKIFKGGKNKYFLNNQIVHPNKILNFLFSINININSPDFLVKQGHITKIAQMNQYELLDFYKNTIGAKLYEIKKKSALYILHKKKTKVEQISFMLNNHINPKLNSIIKSIRSFEYYKKFLLKKIIFFRYEKKIVENFVFYSTEKNVLNIVIFSNFLFFYKLDVDFFNRQNHKNIQKFILSKIFIKKNRRIINRICKKNGEFLSNKILLKLSKLECLLKYHYVYIKNYDNRTVIRFKFEKNFATNINEKLKKIIIKKKTKKLKKIDKNKYCFTIKLLNFILIIKKKFNRIESLRVNCKKYYIFKENLYKIKIKNLKINKKSFSLIKKMANIFLNFDKNYFEINKDLFSNVFCFFEPIISNQQYFIWMLREYIHGILGCLIKLKNIFLITAVDFSINNKLSFLICADHLNSKKILENLKLKKKITILPLDKIISFNKTNQQKLQSILFENYISFDIFIINAVKFIFDGLLIIANLSVVQDITSSNQIRYKFITLDGDIFDSSGMLISGCMKMACFSYYESFLELNNNKITLLRYCAIKFKQNSIDISKKNKQHFFKKKSKFNILKKNSLCFFVKKKNSIINYNNFSFVKKKKAEIEKTLINIFFNFSIFGNFKKKNKKMNVVHKINSTLKIYFISISDKINKIQKFYKLNYKFDVLKYNQNCTYLKKNIFFLKNLLSINKIINQNIIAFSQNFFKFFNSKGNKTIKINSKKFNCFFFRFSSIIFQHTTYNLKFNFLDIKNVLKNMKLELKILTNKEENILQRYILNIIIEYKNIKKKRAIIEKDKLIIEEILKKLEKKKKEIIEKSLKKINILFQNIFLTLMPEFNGKIVSIKSNQGSLVGLNFRVSNKNFEKKNILELSGGQKSLLSLSLIFSLLVFKPSPFYILDEIDNALDSYHTQNVGKIIKNYFSVSQFIVVTLKKDLIISSNVIFKIKANKEFSAIFRYQK
jgi:structural maintenance of chromosome 2